MSAGFRRPHPGSSRLAARLAKALGGRAGLIWSGGPVDNSGQYLHRCPALGGVPVVAASGPDATDGLFVGARAVQCLAK